MNNMQTGNQAIELLLIDSSPNNAENNISTLRNAGLTVHPKTISEGQALIDTLDKTTFDLILCHADNAVPDFTQALTLCRSKAPDTPLILVYQQFDTEQLLDAMKQGARDVVSQEDPTHLQLVITREFGDVVVRKERNLIRKQLSEAENRCTSLVENSRDAIAYIHEGMHVHANPAYLEMFGYVNMDELEGLPILDMIAPDDREQFKHFLKTFDNSAKDLETSCQNAKQNVFKATLEFSPASIDQEPCTQIIIRDHSENLELEEKIKLISNQDIQTGLINRQYFMDRLTELLKSPPKKGHLALYYVVIDDFQMVRSRIGIANSDELLKQIADTLTNIIEESDLLGRFGDHTFTALSRKSNTIDAEPMGEHIRSAISQIYYSDGAQSEHLTSSIGIAFNLSAKLTSQEFINQAYQAFENARTEGGDRFSTYDPAEMSPSYGEKERGDENRINELISYALEHDRFRLVFQPIVSLQGDSRENYAVLTRLMDQNNEEILPNYFMHAAEQSGQMANIDRWIINAAIKELVVERKKGRKINFFINISSSALEDDTLLLWICDCLREHNSKGPWLTFQIKDSDLRTHTQAAKKLIDGLKKIKCQLAIDQFGSNTNSESLLKHLPVDYVKFDNEFIEDLSTNQEKQDKLNELNRLAIANDAKTIAMGVEDANSLAILWTVGVNYIQGYFLQEPSESISYDFSTTG